MIAHRTSGIEAATRHPDFLRAILPTIRAQADRIGAASRHPRAVALRGQYDALLRQAAEIEAMIESAIKDPSR